METQDKVPNRPQQLSVLTGHCLGALDDCDPEREPLYLRTLCLIGFGEFLVSVLNGRTTVGADGLVSCSLEQYGSVADHIDELLAAVPALDGKTSAHSRQNGAVLTVSIKASSYADLESLLDLTIEKGRATTLAAATRA